MVWAASVPQTSCFSSTVSASTSCFVIVSLPQRNCHWPGCCCLRAQDYRENTAFLFSHPAGSPWPEDVDLASFQRVNVVIRKSRDFGRQRCTVTLGTSKEGNVIPVMPVWNTQFIPTLGNDRPFTQKRKKKKKKKSFVIVPSGKKCSNSYFKNLINVNSM